MLQPSRRFRLLQIALLSSAIATTATLIISVGCPVRAELQECPKALVDEVWQVVNRSYVDPTFNSVDWQATRQRLLSKNYTSKKQAYTAVKEALKQLQDPYTLFFDPEEFRNENKYTGQLDGVIGVTMGQNEKTKQLTVVGTLPNSQHKKLGSKQAIKLWQLMVNPLRG